MPLADTARNESMGHESDPFWSGVKGSIRVKTVHGRLEEHTRLPRKINRQDCHDFIWQFPQTLGTGYCRTNVLSTGITVTVSDCRLHHPLESQVSVESCFIMGFSLSGCFTNISARHTKPFTLTSGQNVLYTFSDPKITRKASKGEHLRTIVITIPFERFRAFQEMGALGSVPAIDRALKKNQVNFLNLGQTTLPMHQILVELLACPFQGIARLCFFEAKVMELVAHKLDQVCCSGRPSRLKPCEEEKVHRAREILIRRIQSPPSLQELAGSVGLTHTALNLGFKAIFGATVFEYLRIQRLRCSQVLISEGKMSLTQIAHTLGFGSSSHFSQAFFKQFGIRPSQFKVFSV